MSDTKTTNLVSLEINAKQNKQTKKNPTLRYTVLKLQIKDKKILKEARGNKIQFILRNHESKRRD